MAVNKAQHFIKNWSPSSPFLVHTVQMLFVSECLWRS